MAQKVNILIAHIPHKYWTFQLLGWSLASLYWAYGAYFIQEYSLFYTVLNFIFDVLIGVTLSHLYKIFIQKQRQKKIHERGIFNLALSIVILAVLFMLLVNLKWHVYWVNIRNENLVFVTSLFYWDPPLITGLRLMSIWVLAYHLYHYYKQQLALTAHNAELSILTKEIQIDHLSNQLNPHFLFNSLNSVKSLISEDSTKAKRSIDLLSDLLRSSIYNKKHLTSIEEELQLIYDYIELEKLRLEDRLQLSVNLDKTLLGFQIPSLCIQTLIENALKHGIQNSIKGGLITLSISKQMAHVEIIVQNPGQLIVSEGINEIGLGLKNLKKRLELQYKDKGVFTLEEKPKGFVTGTIKLPLK